MKKETLFAFESTQKFYSTFLLYNHNLTDISKSMTTLYFENETLFDLSSKLNVKFNPYLYSQKEDKQINKTTHYEFNEFYLDYFGKKAELKLGWIQPIKEGTDLLNPLDYVQPKNLSDPTQIKNYSLPGLLIDYNFTSKLTFTALAIVKNRISTSPDIHSPWFPRSGELPFQSSETIAHLPSQVEYTISTNEPENKTYLNNNYLLKLKYSSENIEFLSQYSESISNTPNVYTTLTGDLISYGPPTEINLTNPVVLSLYWNKVKNYSFGFNKPWTNQNILFKFYANEQVSKSQKSIMTTLAIEKQFSTLIFIFEFAQKNISDSTSANTNNQISDFTNFYKNSQALGIKYFPTEKFSLTLGGVYDSIQKSTLAQAKAKYNLGEYFYFEIQKIQISAKENSLLSYFEKNNPLSATLGVVF